MSGSGWDSGLAKQRPHSDFGVVLADANARDVSNGPVAASGRHCNAAEVVRHADLGRVREAEQPTILALGVKAKAECF